MSKEHLGKFDDDLIRPRMVPFDAYPDGGVIGRNPSPKGGTWAVVYVDPLLHVACLRRGGRIDPTTCPECLTTNNVAELIAAVAALEFLPDGWQGRLYTDSMVTRCRLVNPRPAMNGVPGWLSARLYRQRERFASGKRRPDQPPFIDPARVFLLDGHPTPEQLESGVGKRGNPCSRWNVEADELCGALKDPEFNLY